MHRYMNYITSGAEPYLQLNMQGINYTLLVVGIIGIALLVRLSLRK